MKPFNRVDRSMSLMFPALVGIVLPFPLLAYVTGPNWVFVFQFTALLLLPLSIRSRLRGRRRYAAIEQAAMGRRRRINGDHVLFFTEDELDEIALIRGQLMARGIRALGARVQQP